MKKKILKKNTLILFVGLIILSLFLVVYAAVWNYGNKGYDIDASMYIWLPGNGNSTWTVVAQIIEHNKCFTAKYLQWRIFVPSSWSAEMQSFLDNPPAWVTMGYCTLDCNGTLPSWVSAWSTKYALSSYDVTTKNYTYSANSTECGYHCPAWTTYVGGSCVADAPPQCNSAVAGKFYYGNWSTWFAAIFANPGARCNYWSPSASFTTWEDQNSEVDGINYYKWTCSVWWTSTDCYANIIRDGKCSSSTLSLVWPQVWCERWIAVITQCIDHRGDTHCNTNSCTTDYWQHAIQCRPNAWWHNMATCAYSSLWLSWESSIGISSYNWTNNQYNYTCSADQWTIEQSTRASLYGAGTSTVYTTQLCAGTAGCANQAVAPYYWANY